MARSRRPQMAANDGSLTRTLAWDSENRLTRSTDNGVATDYKYDAGGTRVLKRGAYGEILYVNNNYTIRNGGIEGKHIFLGNSRLATKMAVKEDSTASQDTYYYMGDHLGSSSVITNNGGQFHENIEYFPYGETWVHEKVSDDAESMPFKFTAKEQDPETGLYYFGARYYDARLGVWTKPDPIMNSYLPKNNQSNDNLRGGGGVYNTANINLYHYGRLNPIRYIDPNGMETTVTIDDKHHRMQDGHKVYRAYVYKNTKAGSIKHQIKEWFRNHTTGKFYDDTFEVARDTRGKNLRTDRNPLWKYDTNMEMPPGVHKAVRAVHPVKGNVTRIGDTFTPTPLDNAIPNPHRTGENRTWFNFDPYAPSGLDGCIGVLGPDRDYFGGSFTKLDNFITNVIPDLLRPNENVWIDLQERTD